MLMILRLTANISLAYATSHRVSSDDETIPVSEKNSHVTFDVMKNENKSLTFFRASIMAKVLSTDDIRDRITLLEGINDEYEEYSNNYKENIEATISWDSVFTEDREREIKLIQSKNANEDAFVVRLDLIIDALHNNFCRCYRFGLADGLYSQTMINNLKFLKTLDTEYKSAYKCKIVEMIIDYLLVHFYKASGIKDDATTHKSEKVIKRILEHDKELRKLILPEAKSLHIFNNMLARFTFLSGITMSYTIIQPIENKFINNTIIDCHESIRNMPVNLYFTLVQPYILTICYEHHHNMKDLYDNLENLKNNWEARRHTDFEANCIFYLYLMEFTSSNTSLREEFIYSLTGSCEHMRLLFNVKNSNTNSLLSFTISLIPPRFADVLDMWYAKDDATLVRICFKKIIKIVDFRTYLIIGNMNKLHITLSNLNPKDRLNLFKAVIGCYEAYIDYKCQEAVKTRGLITYDLEALNDISRIIKNHLEMIDISKFSKDIGKYIDIIIALKELTFKTMESQREDNPTSFSDYPHLLAFYEEYHMSDCHLNCIYNVCFLLGQSSDGTKLRLHSKLHYNLKTRYFDTAAQMFIDNLRSRKYDIFSYDEETHNTAEHIVRCLIEIKHGKCDNAYIASNYEHWMGDRKIDIMEKQNNVQIQLQVIEDKFWKKIICDTNVENTLEEQSYSRYSIKDLYESRYVSKTDIGRLYDVCCVSICPIAAKYQEPLRLGALYRKNMRNVHVVLCDIMFSAFKLIKSEEERGKDVVNGLDIIEFIFKNYKVHYYTNVMRRIVYEFNIIEKMSLFKELFRLSEVLGVYPLFDTRIKSYFIIVKSKNIVESLLSTSGILSTIRNCGYKLISKYCNFQYSYMRENKPKDDSLIFYNRCTQISNALEDIRRATNDFVIASVLFRFVSRTSSIMFEDFEGGITLVLEIINILYKSMDIKILRSSYPAFKYSYSRIVLAMVGLVFRENSTISNRSFTDFIDSACSVMIELSDNVKLIGTEEKYEISNYKILRDKFFLVIEDINELGKWEAIHSFIHMKIINEVTKYNKIENILKMNMIILNVFRSNKHSERDYYIFISKSYILLREVLVGIEEDSKDYSAIGTNFFSKMCVILLQDKGLLEILGYKIVTEMDEDRKCYICYDIYVTPVKSLHCACKSYSACLKCLLQYDLIQFNINNPVEFTHTCCICKK